MLRSTIKLSIVALLAVGCATPGRDSLRARAHSIEFWADQAIVEDALGEPDTVLVLDKHERGCTQRWAYSECRNGQSSVVFVDFDAQGRVCDHSIGAVEPFHSAQ